MRNADEERKESSTHSNRSIYLPGLRPARQRQGITQRQLASRARSGTGDCLKAGKVGKGSLPANPTEIGGGTRGISRRPGRGSR
jgi:hypothetical protein